MSAVDKTCLSYWLPKIIAAGVPVPKTKIIEAPPEVVLSLMQATNGEESDFNLRPFFDTIRNAAIEMGLPCFLRTGHTSGKHEWDRTCFVKSADIIEHHICALVEHSDCVDIIGLPYGIWAVREMLPTIPAGYCEAYRGMPICREFRFFVRNGNFQCWHPYWPREALDQGSPNFIGNFDYDEFCAREEFDDLTALAEKAGRAVGDYWSVDILETKRGWYVTDMAEGDKSFHWEGCRIAEHHRAVTAA